jgi:hypothetical protein
MKKICIIFFILIAAQQSFSQDYVKVFSEDFNNNFNKWILRNNEEYTTTIANGKFKMVHRGDRYYYEGQTVVNDKKKDLKIEATVSFTKFKKGHAGVIFGCDDEYKNTYFFMISADGTYTYGQWAPQFQTFTGTLKSTAINKEMGANNKLMVEKVGKKLKLYVNGKEVHSDSFPKLYGKNMGVVGGGGNFTAEIDYLSVAQAQ